MRCKTIVCGTWCHGRSTRCTFSTRHERDEQPERGDGGSTRARGLGPAGPCARGACCGSERQPELQSQGQPHARPTGEACERACMQGGRRRGRNTCPARVHQPPTCNSSRRTRSQPSMRAQYCAHARMAVCAASRCAHGQRQEPRKARANPSSHTHSLNSLACGAGA